MKRSADVGRGGAFGVRLGAVVLLLACSEPLERSRVHVLMDADDAVRALAVEVNARVEKQDDKGSGWYSVAEQRFTPADANGWPLGFDLPSRVTEVPGNYQLTATAKDDRDAVLGVARVIRDFHSRSRLATLRAYFEVECLRLTPLCPPGRTCHEGECVSAAATDEELGTVANAARRTQSSMAPNTVQDAGETAIVRAEDACATEGATACATGESQVPLRCEGGRWHSELACPQNERCMPDEGLCRAIARECVGRGKDDVFCDGARMRVCSNPVAPPERPCGEHAACVVKDGEVACACNLGFVRDLVDCRAATECETDHGGCDPLSSCAVVGNVVACGSCPAGYAGDGRTGCLPLLAALDVSGATLSPSLARDVHAYRARVPLLTARAQLIATGPPDTTLEIDTHPITAGTPWLSPILEFGDNAFELTVISKAGVPNSYQLVIERTCEQQAYLKAGSPGSDDLLGLSPMSVSGDTLVVAAPTEDSGSKINGDETNNAAVDSGAAYVFVRDGESWVKQAYLKPDDGAAYDYFASSTTIVGDTIVVGAIRHDLTSSRERPGAAYVFERANGVWSQTAHLAPMDSAVGDSFGTSVSLDADTLVVGTPRHGGSVNSEGAAHVYTRTGGVWTEQQTLHASKPAAGAHFGTQVSIRDGVIVVAAEEEAGASGAAYVFTRGPQGWMERQRLAPESPSNGQRFGWSLATRGDTLVIGSPYFRDLMRPSVPAGSVYVFQRTGDAWQQTGILRATVPRSNDFFGVQLALTSQTIVIGASGDDSAGRGVRADPMRVGATRSGATYVFSRDQAGWRSPTFIKPSNTGAEDGFGYSVGATETELFVGAPWESSDGDQTDNSVSASGAVYVFR